MKHVITAASAKQFCQYLLSEEKSRATVEKYSREVERLSIFLQGSPVSKLKILEYREWIAKEYQAQTVNGKLSAVNAYLQFINRGDCKVKLLKIQRRAFLRENRELNSTEYRRLLEAAKKKGESRLYYMILTLCSTGIRISELQFVTVEALKAGVAQIRLKGKSRTVVLPKQLSKRLREYTRSKGILHGPIFCTRTGRPVDRSNVCHEMKRLCPEAKVDREKVFPHNLRHLFARSFYALEKDIAHLADILGHSSIETTRIYTADSIRSHEKIIGRMKLIL